MRVIYNSDFRKPLFLSVPNTLVLAHWAELRPVYTLPRHHQVQDPLYGYLMSLQEKQVPTRSSFYPKVASRATAKGLSCHTRGTRTDLQKKINISFIDKYYIAMYKIHL